MQTDDIFETGLCWTSLLVGRLVGNPFFFFLLSPMGMNGSSKAEITNQEKTGERWHAIPHSRSYKAGARYKLSAQRFVGSLEWTNVSYDWSLVFTATSNQS